MKWIKDLFTEADGDSVDVTIVMGVASLAMFFALIGHAVFLKDKDFNAIDFGTAVGMIIAATGAGARLKPQAKINKEEQ